MHSIQQVSSSMMQVQWGINGERDIAVGGIVGQNSLLNSGLRS